ncbi:MAG: leucine-rich repeat protein [Clostridiales bacterium]|nr:leucine-rich repeat protein [Clostridiales bacterium]
MRKRMIAFLTVAALSVSLFSTSAYAAEDQTGATAEAVYEESDEEVVAEGEADEAGVEDESAAVIEKEESTAEDTAVDTGDVSGDAEVETDEVATEYTPEEDLTAAEEISSEESDTEESDVEKSDAEESDTEESDTEESDADVSVSASATDDSGSCGSSAAWTLSSDGILTISGSGAMTDYSDYTSVPWYSYGSSISAIVVSSGITHIGDFSFVECSAVTVSLPSGLLTIGEASFYGCASLTSVVIPNTVTGIEIAAFADCTALSSVTLGSGLSTIENYTFQNCTALTSLTIPSNVTYVDTYAFTGCTNLKVTSSTLTKLDDGSYQLVATVKLKGTCDYTKAYQVLKLVNKERKAEGLSTLTMDKELLSAAMQRAAECNLYFSHTRPSGLSCFTVSSEAWGENIAAGQSTASAVMTTWMNSSGHKANILGSSYQSIGIGCFTQGGVTYWVQIFGTDTATKLSQPSNATKTFTVALSPEIFDGCLYLYSSTSSLKTGKSTTVKARVTNPGWSSCYAELTGPSLSWSSSSTSIASVNSSGKSDRKRCWNC